MTDTQPVQAGAELLVEQVARALAIEDGKDPDAHAWIRYPGNEPYGLCWRDQYASKARAALSVLNTRITHAGGSSEKVGSALSDIAAERERQISGEGWTLEHDDAHDNGALAEAAACYAVGSNDIYRIGTNVRGNATVSRHLWPWDIKWWKPRTDRRRQLVKAGALIVAEIERLDRQALADQPK